jgi:hypothetical protein
MRDSSPLAKTQYATIIRSLVQFPWPDQQGAFSPIMSKPSVDAFLSNSLFNPSSEPSLASARESAVSLPSAFQGLDLLLVSSPPPSLSLLSPSVANLPFSLADPAPPLGDAVQKARPRYIFWGEGEGFWEREPFGWAGEGGKDERWTRAVKLGALGGEEHQGVKKARVSHIRSLLETWCRAELAVVLRVHAARSIARGAFARQTCQRDSESVCDAGRCPNGSKQPGLKEAPNCR